MSDQTPWNSGGYGPPPQLPPQSHPQLPPHVYPMGSPPPPAYPPPAYPPHPPFGGGPPPRRRGPVLIVAGLTTAAVVAGLLIWSPWSSDSAGTPAGNPSVLSSPKDPAKIAEASLRAAADTLAGAQVVSYEGRFTDSDDKVSKFSLQSNGAGWSRGSLTSGKHTVRLLTADDNHLMKAGKAYWKAQDYSDTTVGRFSDHWLDSAVELPDASALTTPLAPANLAQLMRDAANRGHVTPGTETILDGVRAQRLYTPEARYYVTVSTPHTLVRVQAAGSSSSSTASPGTSDSTGPVALPDDADATVTELTGVERSGFTKAYKKDLGALTSAVDPNVTFSTSGKARFSPCGNYSCTARFTLRNLVYDPLDSGTGESVQAVITIDVKLDGRKVKHCVFHRTMKANGKVSLTCRATYSASRYSNHTVRGVPDAWARTVSDKELKKLKAGFASSAKSTGSTDSGDSA